MNTIGEILKTARNLKKISLSEIERETKIKIEFIKLIEENAWDKLPAFPVVSGFVRNLAIMLDIPPENANAILRRDYPPQKLPINPKPDVKTNFFWSPKLAFGLGVTLLVLMVLSYLGFEYFKFIKPPDLEIFSPKNNGVVLNNKVSVSGRTTTDVFLTINNQPIIIDQEGNFATELQITPETNNLKFIAVSRSGKTTEKIVNINVE